MSNIDKQALRERYSPQPSPKCHICGTEMTVQRMSASRITYGCTGATYDDDGCHYADGRSIADDHYEQSRVTVVDVSDPDVLALLDELEAAQKRVAELENDEVRQRLANAEHQLHMAELAKHNLKASRKAQFRKRLAAEKRIAELEAREVKLPPTLWYEHDDLPREIPVLSRRLVINALREDGVKVAAGIGKGE